MRGLKAATVAATVMVCVAAGGCGSGESRDQANGAFSVAILEPSSLLPANYSEIYGSQVVTSLFTPLVTFDPKTNETKPAAAESIESRDNAHWEIKLNDGWTFHDGDPVTAASFVDAWNFAARPDSAQLNAYVFANIQGYDEVTSGEAEEMAGLSVVDDLSFTVDLTTPNSQFEILLGYPAFSPLPNAAFADPAAFEQAPIGNGPFQMEGEWIHDQEIKLTRFADYAGEAAKAEALTYRIYQSLDTAYNDLLSENVDVVPGIPASKVGDARNVLGDRYEEFESGRMEYLGFPIDSPQFDSPDVRRAISMAIDREAVSEVIFAGTREPATGFVPSLVPGAAEDACGQACVHDPQAARDLFTSAPDSGPSDGFTIGYNTDSSDNKPWVEAVASQLSDALGVEVTTKPYPTLAVLLEKLGEGSVDSAFRTAWTFYYPSLGNYLEPMFAEDSPENFSGYFNEEFEQLLDDAREASSVEEAGVAYLSAEQVVLADMPYVPLWTQAIPVGNSEQVDGVSMDAFRRIHVEDITVN